MDIVVLRRDQPLSWALMPQLLNRLMRFLDSYDTDTPKQELFEQVSRMFAAGDGRLGVWMIVDGSKVVGHLLAQPEPVGYEQGPWQYVLIRQAEVDPKVDARALTKQVMALVEGWAQRLGTTKIYMLTHRNDAAMARRWGFTFFKHLMAKPVGQKSLGPQGDNGISEVTMAVDSASERGS